MALAGKIVFGVLGAAIAGVGGFFALGQASQKGSAPGLVGGTLAPCPSSPNCVSSEPGTPGEKRVAPLGPEVWDKLPRAIEAMGGTITSQTQDYIAAEFTSQRFGFVDDLELRKGEAQVHVRSASRVGYSDRGVNAERVAELRSKLSQ
jgi:uncharacterized protein (DUF1499 family)